MPRQLVLLLIVIVPLFQLPVRADGPIGPDEGRPHVRAENASRVVGQLAFVSGKVTSTGKSRRVNFLNFAEGDNTAFTGVVFEDALRNFSASLSQFDGKFVRVRGFVSEYRGRPEMIISRPGQIEILSELPAVPALPEVRAAKQTDSLTLATFNVLNLFDDEDDPYFADESTPTKPRLELEFLAKSIRRLDADIIALQEVESRGYLERFLAVFLGDLQYEVVHFEGNDVRGIDVCLISRVPVGRVISHRHVSFPGPNGKQRRFSRDILSVRMEPPGRGAFDVWVVHLKSNSDGREHAEPIRVAEAAELRKMLDRELSANPAARIFVVGDFNDTLQSETLKTVIGKRGSYLWSASEDSRAQDLITYNQEPHREMIDFILCSPEAAKLYQKDSFAIEPGAPQMTGSDHNPVVARFRLAPAD